MLTTIAVVLLLLWFLGAIGVYAIGWFIHVLLVLALVVLLLRIIYGEYPFVSR